ncbi:g3637 [Coccomyxa elongata]
MPSAGGAQPRRQQQFAQPSQAPAWSRVSPAVQPRFMAATPMQPPHGGSRTNTTLAAAAEHLHQEWRHGQRRRKHSGSFQAAAQQVQGSRQHPTRVESQAPAASGLQQAAVSGAAAAAQSQQGRP